MTRTRASAKAAGSRFERLVADWLREVLQDDRVDRRVKRGNKDRGDLSGLRIHGQRLVAELKDTARMDLGGWAAEAEVERMNDDALAAVIISKRHGRGRAADQWVHMTLADFAALLTGERPPVDGEPIEPMFTPGGAA